LQHSSDGVSWSEFASLPVQQSSTPVLLCARRYNFFDNYFIDIETGYFTGERSQQIAIAYASAAGQYKLELWDVRDGFHPTSWLSWRLPSPAGLLGSPPRCEWGWRDDIAVVNLLAGNNYQVSIYHTQVDMVNGPHARGIQLLIYAGDLHLAAAALAAGDLNGDLETRSSSYPIESHSFLTIPLDTILSPVVRVRCRRSSHCTCRSMGR
jgi:hypothetical protein